MKRHSVSAVVLILLYFLSGCGTLLKPFPPPTVTATHAPATHIPTRTLTPRPFTETPTWTNTRTSTPDFTATPAGTSSPAPTDKPLPSFTPTAAATVTPIMPTIPAGRRLTPFPRLPGTGGEPDRTQTPSACQYYTLQLGMLGDDIVIYLQCVKDLIGNEVS